MNPHTQHHKNKRRKRSTKRVAVLLLLFSILLQQSSVLVFADEYTSNSTDNITSEYSNTEAKPSENNLVATPIPVAEDATLIGVPDNTSTTAIPTDENSNNVPNEQVESILDPTSSEEISIDEELSPVSFSLFGSLMSIAPMQATINGTNAIVYTEEDLSVALLDPTITYIQFGADITATMSGTTNNPSYSFLINPGKSSLTIDGTDPVDGSIHTYTDNRAANTKPNTLGIYSNGTTSIPININNLNIVGCNAGGFISSATNKTYYSSTLTFNNVTYAGPELTYYLGPVVINNSNITIQSGTGIWSGKSQTNNGQSAADCVNITLGGTTTIIKNPNGTSNYTNSENVFNLYHNGTIPSSFSVFDQSNVTVTINQANTNTQPNGLVQFDATSPAGSFTIGKNANLQFNGQNIIFTKAMNGNFLLCSGSTFASVLTSTQGGSPITASTLTIDTNAMMSISTTSTTANNATAFLSATNYNINSGATLQINSASSGQLSQGILSGTALNVNQNGKVIIEAPNSNPSISGANGGGAITLTNLLVDQNAKFSLTLGGVKSQVAVALKGSLQVNQNATLILVATTPSGSDHPFINMKSATFNDPKRVLFYGLPTGNKGSIIDNGGTVPITITTQQMSYWTSLPTTAGSGLSNLPNQHWRVAPNSNGDYPGTFTITGSLTGGSGTWTNITNNTYNQSLDTNIFCLDGKSPAFDSTDPSDVMSATTLSQAFSATAIGSGCSRIVCFGRLVIRDALYNESNGVITGNTEANTIPTGEPSMVSTPIVNIYGATPSPTDVTVPNNGSVIGQATYNYNGNTGDFNFNLPTLYQTNSTMWAIAYNNFLYGNSLVVETPNVYTITINYYQINPNDLSNSLGQAKTIIPTQTQANAYGQETIELNRTLYTYKPLYYIINNNGNVLPYTYPLMIDVEQDTQVDVYYASSIVSAEIPLQMTWAAFSSGNGSIVSPSYTITNLSDLDINVSLDYMDTYDYNTTTIAFTPNTTPDLAGLITPSGTASLTVTNLAYGFTNSTIGGTTIYADTLELGYTLGSLQGNLTQVLQSIGITSSSTDTKGGFSLGGSYSGSYAVPYQQPETCCTFVIALTN